MITAEEFIKDRYNWSSTDLERWSENLSRLPMADYGNVIDLMTNYAKKAIKVDRLNLLEHAEVYFDEGTTLENVHIDKDSIINAPNIQLL